jgi:hypothetical protein
VLATGEKEQDFCPQVLDTNDHVGFITSKHKTINMIVYTTSKTNIHSHLSFCDVVDLRLPNHM